MGPLQSLFRAPASRMTHRTAATASPRHHLRVLAHVAEARCDQATSRCSGCFVSSEAAGKGTPAPLQAFRRRQRRLVLLRLRRQAPRRPRPAASVQVVEPQLRGQERELGEPDRGQRGLRHHGRAAHQDDPRAQQHDLRRWDVHHQRGHGRAAQRPEVLGGSQDADGNWYWWQFYVNGKLNEYAAEYAAAAGRPDRGSSSASTARTFPSRTFPRRTPRQLYMASAGALQVRTARAAHAADTATTGSKLAWMQDLVTAQARR